ncbi:MAG: DUF2325 domain-containing protein [Lachnospiraceae bacterium]|nr:DUF2325 domain-containing protein [Lachnospiraceae bacterium]
MSIVILGGNERMEREYKDLCKAYNCRAKVFTKPSGNLRSKIGTPDLMIFFTGTMSHKMVNAAMCEVKGGRTEIARSHTSSMAALREILDIHVPKEAVHV